MPHITIELYSGRSTEEKIKIAEAVQNALCSQTGHRNGAVSVSIVDVPKEEWKEKVFDRISDDENIVLRPDYKM